MIKYLKGDATYPKLQTSDNKSIVIAHVCNNKGKWGAGFVLSLTKRWTLPQANYLSLNVWPLKLVQFLRVESNIFVANMIAQDGLYNKVYNPLPIKYEELKQCLITVNEFAEIQNAEIHMPKIGSGLAKGKWEIIESIINEVCKVPTFVYTLN